MSIERLYRLQAENTARQIEMLSERGRFIALEARHETGNAPRAVSSFNLFQTPEHIAHKMLDCIQYEDNQKLRILEPSAGLGRLLIMAVKRFYNAEFVAVENNVDCIRELYQMNIPRCALKCADFLTVDNIGLFDVIIMNPPFKRGRDIKHILHAKTLLKPGGVIVSLCYDGVRQGRNLKPLCDFWEPLPKDTFKEAGTSADVVMVTITN